MYRLKFLASVTNLRCEGTLAQANGINTDKGKSVRGRWTMKVNRLVVFTTSLWWTVYVKVVSRETPKCLTTVTWRIRWLVSASENGEQMGEMFPFVRPLTGRPHFSTRPKRKKRKTAQKHLYISQTRNGPNHLPWGKPQRQGASSERSLSIWTWYDWSIQSRSTDAGKRQIS